MGLCGRRKVYCVNTIQPQAASFPPTTEHFMPMLGGSHGFHLTLKLEPIESSVYIIAKSVGGMLDNLKADTSAYARITIYI